jgi:hypothetical protein
MSKTPETIEETLQRIKQYHNQFSNSNIIDKYNIEYNEGGEINANNIVVNYGNIYSKFNR